MNGFLNLLKPPGMTSSDAVVWVRRMLPRGTKVGHAGTLDPMAAGVLPIMIGKATRLFDYAAGADKEYLAVLCLGSATDTQDNTGRQTAKSPHRPSDAEIREALASYTGEISQIPPAYSALKQNGQKLYELARKGILVEKPPRTVQVHSFELTERISLEEALIRVVCGKGTYIRTLCFDVGEKLGCFAHMGFLLRQRVGVFSLADAIALEELTPETVEASLRPIDFPLAHLPRAIVRDTGEAACRNGNPLTSALLDHPVETWAEGEVLRIDCGGRFIGLGRRHGTQIRFDAMLADWDA